VKALNIFFILMIVSALIVGCGEDDDHRVARPPDDVEQQISQFSMVRTQNGLTKWKLKADSTTLREEEKVSIEGVELLIFNDKGNEAITIYGDKGEVDQRTNNLKITGNVKGISSDGGILDTEEIYWRDRTGKLYTMPGVKVTITHEDTVIVGYELESDPELDTANLKSVTGITRAEEKEK